MFEKGKIAIFGDSITWGTDARTALQKANNLDIWSNALKHKHSDYEIVVNGLAGRRLFVDYSTNFKRDGSKQIEEFIYSTFPIKKLVIFLGTNDIVFERVHTSQLLKERLIKFKKIIDESIEALYKEKKPEIYFITMPTFNFKSLKEWLKQDEVVRFDDPENIFKIFSELDSNIIDITSLKVNSVDGVHFSNKNEKEILKIVEKSLF